MAKTRQIYTGKKPKMKITSSKKYADDQEWFKMCVDYFITNSRFKIQDEDYEFTRRLYDMYNNRIYEDTFDYISNPYNAIDNDTYTFPAKVRPYNIVRPIVDRFLGDFKERPYTYTVKVNNPDAVSIMKDQQHQRLLQSMEQLFINTASQLDPDNYYGEVQQPETPEEIQRFFNHEYKDDRAAQGQFVLDYINEKELVFEKHNDMFIDWLIAGEVFSYKEPLREDMYYQRIDPLYFDYDHNRGNKYVEDAEWAVRLIYMNISDIVDYFYDELTPKEIDMLEKFVSTGNSGITTARRSIHRERDWSYDTVEVYHIVWKAYDKIGILKYLDEFGREQEEVVDDTYKPREGEEIEWLWVSRVYEGWRIYGEGNKEIYLRIRPIPHQRHEVNQKSSCKLPYNGVRYSDRNSRNTSLMRLLYPYQVMYIIVMYYIERLLAKHRGNVFLIDKNVIPRNGNWDMTRWLHMVEAAGIMFIDRNNPNADRSFNQYNSMNLSTLNEIIGMMQLADFYRNECFRLANIPPERMGEASASQRASAIDEVVSNSLIATEEVFANFDDFVRSEWAGILDVSKFCWVSDGLKKMMVSNDLRNSILELDPIEYTEADFGLTITSSRRDKKILDIMKQRTQEFSQNGTDPVDVLSILESQSIAQMRNKLKEVKQDMLKREEDATKNEQSLQESQDRINKQFALFEHALSKELEQMKIDGQIKIAQINNELSDGSNDEAKTRLEYMSKERDRQQKDNEVRINQAMKAAELGLKNKEIESKERIENKKAETALKNKVAGEK